MGEDKLAIALYTHEESYYKNNADYYAKLYAHVIIQIMSSEI